ncbi:hypothetical protein [Oscillibacter sp.]|uniref:hypothetical protein n=1 Tax=Oscillibacter sp. TaxID=1945593 RepID=UPI0026149F95|nr:hypothetical protein [Oscillibacter sp.]MDD3347116.1 hypothetical protein [Oscillibacter sp.]
MERHVQKKQKNRYILIALVLTLYFVLSVIIGFPLGFGNMMARSHARDYCEAVYPEATLGKTIFNPVDNNFSTRINLENDSFTIGTNPNKKAVVDYNRREVFLQDTGVFEALSKLQRTHVSIAKYGWITCYVYWNYDDPMTPIAMFRMDYTDAQSTPLPNDDEMKELLTPLALDCITSLNEYLPLNSIQLLYYHPAFNPDEKGMTWRIVKMDLEDDTPMNQDLLKNASVRVN